MAILNLQNFSDKFEFISVICSKSLDRSLNYRRGGEQTFSDNVSKLLPHYTVSHPRRQYSLYIPLHPCLFTELIMEEQYDGHRNLKWPFLTMSLNAFELYVRISRNSDCYQLCCPKLLLCGLMLVMLLSICVICRSSYWANDNSIP